jgi:hypothetical protein
VFQADIAALQAKLVEGSDRDDRKINAVEHNEAKSSRSASRAAAPTTRRCHAAASGAVVPDASNRCEFFSRASVSRRANGIGVRQQEMKPFVFAALAYGLCQLRSSMEEKIFLSIP